MRKVYGIASVAVLGIIILCLVPPFALQFFCLLFCLTAFCMALAYAVKNPFLKYLAISIFSLTLPIMALEGYYYIYLQQERGISRQIIQSSEASEQKSKQQDVIPKQNLTRRSDDIGYVAVPNAVVHSASVRDGVQIYDVVYTIDNKGRRITPNAPNARTAVLLLGCSFTLGEGLNDTEVLAWKLGEALGSDYQVFNYGLSGYGPHHMQAILEKGIPELKSFDRVLAYHIAIDGHQRRVAGISPWDTQGPRYVLEEGRAVRKGSFADMEPFFWEGDLGPWLERSMIFQFLKQPLSEVLVPLNTVEKRLELTRALIVTSADILHKEYPKSKFTVLAYPPNTARILPPLPDNIPLVDVEAWLPNFATDSNKYIIPLDSHPNALANSIMAEHLLPIVQQDAASLTTP